MHKGHKIHYLPKTAKACSRCDCGDPNNLNIPHQINRANTTKDKISKNINQIQMNAMNNHYNELQGQIQYPNNNIGVQQHKLPNVQQQTPQQQITQHIYLKQQIIFMKH